MQAELRPLVDKELINEIIYSQMFRRKKKKIQQITNTHIPKNILKMFLYIGE